MKNFELRRAIAKRIKDGIETKGWNRKEFIVQMNSTYEMSITPGTVTRWLGGNHNFTIRTIFQIEEVLEITIITVTKSITNESK